MPGLHGGSTSTSASEHRVLPLKRRLSLQRTRKPRARAWCSLPPPDTLGLGEPLAAGRGAGSSRQQPAALQGLLAGIPGPPDPWVSSVTHSIMATARMGYVFPRGGREPWEAAGRQGQGSRQAGTGCRRTTRAQSRLTPGYLHFPIVIAIKGRKSISGSMVGTERAGRGDKG